jgi:hypothetical protein
LGFRRNFILQENTFWTFKIPYFSWVNSWSIKDTRDWSLCRSSLKGVVVVATSLLYVIIDDLLDHFAAVELANALSLDESKGAN